MRALNKINDMSHSEKRIKDYTEIEEELRNTNLSEVNSLKIKLCFGEQRK
jgi:hypothetical protein